MLRTPSPEMLRTPSPKMLKSPGLKNQPKTNFREKKHPDRKSAGVEIDPTPRGIIFSLLGLPGGQNSRQNPKISKFPKTNPTIPLNPISHTAVSRSLSSESHRQHRMRCEYGSCAADVVIENADATPPHLDVFLALG